MIRKILVRILILPLWLAFLSGPCRAQADMPFSPKEYQVWARKADSLEEAYKHRNYRLFFRTFPGSFRDFNGTYGFAGSAMPGYRFYASHIQYFFSSSTEVSKRFFYTKMLRISVGGNWDADAVSSFQDGLRHSIEAEPRLTADILATFPTQEQVGFWRFVFDNPEVKPMQALYERLYPLFKSVDHRLAAQMQTQYAYMAIRISTYHDQLPDSIQGRPVRWYLDNPQVDPLAKAFYRGQFRPSDDSSTQRLFNLILVPDSSLRPFYRYCLNESMLIADGALGDYLGNPALNYLLRYPVELFRYMDEDTSGDREKMWGLYIGYSGLPSYIPADKERVCTDLMTRFDTYCKPCRPETRTRFAKMLDGWIVESIASPTN